MSLAANTTYLRKHFVHLNAEESYLVDARPLSAVINPLDLSKFLALYTYTTNNESTIVFQRSAL